MYLSRENGGLHLRAGSYSLEFAADRPFVYVSDPQGERVVDLFVLSGVQPLNGLDDTTQVGPWQVEEGPDEVVFSLQASSSVWDRKVYRFRCRPSRFTYEIEVTGSGQIAEVNYFGGYASAQARWGSGFFWSGQRFKQGFNPEPTVDEIYTFPTEANSVINMTGVPLPGRADWFFTPPPFCFAFEYKNNWVGLGVEARPGENTYVDYRYQGARSAFHVSLTYEGHTRVAGSKRLPAIAFDFGPDPYSLLDTHVRSLRAARLAPVPSVKSRPPWWSEPIFCGWGAQNHLAACSGGRAADYARQAHYEKFMRDLSSRSVFPGTVVIDDKWQASYGENDVDPHKWPDLPGFIRARHEAGQRVLLWLKAWDPENVPVEECITNAAGLPLAVDPTNPAYEQRLRRSIRRMLGPVEAGGYGADGFKIDFSARIPSGPGIRAYGEAWGLELMRKYLSIIQDEARRVKSDAFIITHTPHPYLADLIDAVRLNDINTHANVRAQMIHRACVAAIACPEALIDMDNWPLPDKAAWRDYLTLRPVLGIPALYYASHIDSTGEELTAEDFSMLREVWARYRAVQAGSHRRKPIHKTAEPAGLQQEGFPQEAGRLPQLKKLISPVSQMLKPLKTTGSESYHGLN